MRYVHRNSANHDFMYRKLGEATFVLLHSDRKSVRISSIGAFVFPFAKLGQIAIFRSQTDHPAAYMIWAYVTERTLAALKSDPSRLLEIEELNAGDHLVIVDIVSHLRDISPVITKIKEIMAGNFDRFFAPRFDKLLGHLVIREYCVPKHRLSVIRS